MDRRARLAGLMAAHMRHVEQILQAVADLHDVYGTPLPDRVDGGDIPVCYSTDVARVERKLRVLAEALATTADEVRRDDG